jgi:hypothetical protein
MRQPPQKFVAAVVMNDRLRDDGAERGHRVAMAGRGHHAGEIAVPERLAIESELPSCWLYQPVSRASGSSLWTDLSQLVRCAAFMDRGTR